MIDIDKYTGHTRGPWKRSKAKITTRFSGDEIIVNTGETSWEADMYLIADAPLLLQEIKRLRKKNYKLKRFVENIEWGLKGLIE